MRIKVIEKGRLAGRNSELAFVDTEKLTTEEQQVVESVLRSPLWRLSKQLAKSNDFREYQIQIFEGSEERSLSFRYNETRTQPLFDLIQQLLTLRTHF